MSVTEESVSEESVSSEKRPLVRLTNLHGLTALPKAECLFALPIPNSSMLVLAKTTAPRFSRRRVTALSNAPGPSASVVTKLCRTFEPAVVGAPGTKKLSLTAMGTPSRRLRLRTNGA